MTEEQVKQALYKQAVLDLKFWQEGQDFFTCKLYSLMAKADVGNFAKLAIGFPIQAKAFSDWYHSPNPEAFFNSVFNIHEASQEDDCPHSERDHGVCMECGDEKQWPEIKED